MGGKQCLSFDILKFKDRQSRRPSSSIHSISLQFSVQHFWTAAFVPGVVERMKSSKMEGGATPKLLGLILVICTLPLSGANSEEESKKLEAETKQRALSDMIVEVPAGTQAKSKVWGGFRPMYITIDFTKSVEDTDTNRPLLTGIQNNLKALVKLGKSGVAVASNEHINVLYAIHYPQIAQPTSKVFKWVPRGKKNACQQLVDDMVESTHSRKDLKQFVRASYKHCIIAYFVHDKDLHVMASEKGLGESASETTLMDSQPETEETQYLARLKNYLDVLLKASTLEDSTITRLGERRISQPKVIKN